MAMPGRVTVQILAAPVAREAQSQQLDLGQWNYDEHKCAPPIVDPVILAQLYSRNVAHKACVDAKTSNCVGLGWHFEAKPGADPDQVEETSLLLQDFLDLCSRRDQKTFTELLTAARKDEEAVGWGAIEITRTLSGQVDGFFHVHAYTLRHRKDRDGWVQKVNGQYRYFRNYGQKAEETQDPDSFAGRNEVLVIGEDSPDSPFYPMPDHVPALGDIAGDEAAQAYQLQFFRNNAVPRIAICVDGGKLDPDTKTYILEYLREGIRGEAHKTLILETEPNKEVKIHVEKLTVGNREDADFMAYRKWARDTVIMSHRVPPSKITIVENANLANSKDQDKTFKEQVIKPDQERYEARIQWLLEDEFGADLPVLFHFNEMDLADEEQIAKTRAHYMAAMTNNEVRELYGLGAAGVDPETGKVIDPVLEEWGRAPFEQQVNPFAPTGGMEPLTKSVSPQHRAFVEAAGQLGYLIERIEELAEPDADPYADPALPPERGSGQTVVLQKGALQLVAPSAPLGPRRVVRDTEFKLGPGGVIVGKREVETALEE